MVLSERRKRVKFWLWPLEPSLQLRYMRNGTARANHTVNDKHGLYPKRWATSGRPLVTLLRADDRWNNRH